MSKFNVKVFCRKSFSATNEVVRVKQTDIVTFRLQRFQPRNNCKCIILANYDS